MNLPMDRPPVDNGGPAGSAAIHVLLVEDSAADAELVARQLSKCAEPPFTITCAQSVSAALPIAQCGAHDVVLLDLALSDSIGLAGLREIALAVPRTPIVVLTGADEFPLAVHAIQYGAQDYLVKGDTSAGQLARALRMAIERKSCSAQLAERANFDQLTGLVNRALFRDRLAHALARAKRDHVHAALLYVDLDRFKVINDTLGHSAGDEVLRLVAERFRSAVRECETIARLGGDEFAILLESLHDALPAARAAERILAAFRAPLSIAGEAVRVTLSIGMAFFPDHAENAEALLCSADAAMFRAKRAGSNNVHVFDDMQAATRPGGDSRQA